MPQVEAERIDKSIFPLFARYEGKRSRGTPAIETIDVEASETLLEDPKLGSFRLIPLSDHILVCCPPSRGPGLKVYDEDGNEIVGVREFFLGTGRQNVLLFVNRGARRQLRLRLLETAGVRARLRPPHRTLQAQAMEDVPEGEWR